MSVGLLSQSVEQSRPVVLGSVEFCTKIINIAVVFIVKKSLESLMSIYIVLKYYCVNNMPIASTNSLLHAVVVNGKFTMKLFRLQNYQPRLYKLIYKEKLIYLSLRRFYSLIYIVSFSFYIYQQEGNLPFIKEWIVRSSWQIVWAKKKILD